MSTTSKTRIPDWYEEYRKSYSAGKAHGFLLHGDTEGYAFELLTQKRFLVATLAKKRPVVVLYDLASGITFADENMRKGAINLVRGRDIDGKTDEEEESDPFAQAMEGIGASDTPDDPFDVKDPLDAFAVLEQLLRSPKGNNHVALVVDYLDKIVPQADKGTMDPDSRKIMVMLQKWGSDFRLGNCNNPMFLLCRDIEDIHKDIRSRASGYEAIKIPLPDYRARREFLQFYLSRPEGSVPFHGLSVDEMARMTSGLNLKNLEELLLLAEKAGGMTADLTKKAKDDIIKNEYGNIVEIIDPLPGGFSDLGGMDDIIAWMQAEIIDPIRAGDAADVPKGILLVGPPGTGKTFTVRAVAREAGFNALAINMENILGGIVGTSERNMQEALELARSMAPVVLFIDEIDQSDAGSRGNSSGNPVAKNLFSALLRFMGDATLRGKVIVFFASNRPDLLDSALIRFGRIDEILPMRLADEGARQQIVKAQAKLQGCSIDQDAAEYIAKRSEKYSAADLEAVVRHARKKAKRMRSDTIRLAEAKMAINNIMPNTPKIADYYMLLAIQACNNRELLKPHEIELLENPASFKKKVQAAKSDVPNLATFDEGVRKKREE